DCGTVITMPLTSEGQGYLLDEARRRRPRADRAVAPAATERRKVDSDKSGPADSKARPLREDPPRAVPPGGTWYEPRRKRPILQALPEPTSRSESPEWLRSALPRDPERRSYRR